VTICDVMKAARTGGLPSAISLQHDQVSAEGRHTHTHTHTNTHTQQFLRDAPHCYMTNR